MSTSTSTSIVVAPPAGPVTDAAEALETARLSDTRGPIRMGFWVLIVGFGLFLAWAAWAPLDEGVSSPATVSVESRRTPIQHIQGGVVRKLLVREGSEVKQGDVLIELDDGVARATYEQILQNYLSQRALEARLLAETTGAPSITFHPDLLASKDPQAAQHMAVQKQLFAARIAAREADLAALRETMNTGEAQLSGLREVVQAKRAQQALQSQQLGGVKALAEEGFLPRNQALQLEQSQAELRSTVADLEGNAARTQSIIAESRMRIAQKRQEYLKEASASMADVRREVQANQEKLVAMTAELGRMQIKAPVSGQVIGLAAFGPGSVVSPGQKLMDILPRGEDTILDVRISPQFIDRVAVGNEVEVRFSAFANKPHLVVLGKLVSLSGDAVTEAPSQTNPAGGGTHYVGRVELTPSGVKALGKEVVQPGMTAEVLIKTGERSLLTYLLHPLTKRVAASMTEQ